MFNFRKEKVPQGALSAVESLLSEIEKLGGDLYFSDDYIHRTCGYLRYAQHCSLGSQDIVDSCLDLAETYTDIPEVVAARQSKINAWQKARETELSIERSPVEVEMELDPIYFDSILRGDKTYEGRAYKPDSDKNYPGIRSGDSIRFRLSGRKEEFADEAVRRGLILDAEMICTVKEIYFAPTVHGMYQIPRFNGLGFQPMINGASEMLQLQRAAVYHTFPGYHELISEHGFLGIQVENPRLVEAT